MAREAAGILSVDRGMSTSGGKSRKASDIRGSQAIHLRISEVQVDVKADVRALAAG